MSRTDEDTDQWFPAKVQEIDKDKQQVLVHYMQWNSRHDEWVASNSPRLRPVVRSSARFDSSSSNGGMKGSSPTTGSSPVVSNDHTAQLTKDFKTGDKVILLHLCSANSN